MAYELDNYSWFDKFVHRLVFCSPRVQIAAAELEDRLFRGGLDSLEMGAPVFITSLPRAGTTILLTALNSTPELGSCLYRDMPFIAAPLLWASLSHRHRKSATWQERVHGDGIKISYDSPEAFEEVMWRTFWPEKFKSRQTSLWSINDLKSQETDCMLRHFKKIVALRCKPSAQPGRYLSKNNGNIARLALIKRMFPESQILIPVRSPLAHATSLHRQHLNFLKRYADDGFALRYMESLGHYEFGALHRPILFSEFQELSESLTPNDVDYWLAYWISAFQYVALNRNHVHIIDYDDMCRRSDRWAIKLCELLSLDETRAPTISKHFQIVRQKNRTIQNYGSRLRDRAEAVYSKILAN